MGGRVLPLRQNHEIEGHRRKDQRNVFHLHGYEPEHEHRVIWKENSRRDHQPVYDAGIANEQARCSPIDCNGTHHRGQCTNQGIPNVFSPPQSLFNLRPEHPQDQHVHEKMHKSSVRQRRGDDLVNAVLNNKAGVRQAKERIAFLPTCHAQYFQQRSTEKDRRAYPDNQERNGALRAPPCVPQYGHDRDRLEKAWFARINAHNYICR